MIVLQICTRQQSMKCLPCPSLQSNFLTFFSFVCICALQQLSFNNTAALWECDVDKWAITGAIFTCHICGQHDLRLALLMLNVSCKSCACQRRRLGRQRGPLWHVIHHWLHSAATAVSLPPPLTDRWPHWGRSSRTIRYLSGITDSHAASLSRQRTKNLFLHVLCWHLYQ